MKWILLFLFLYMSTAFQGIYQVLYPIKKLVRFDHSNHVIDNKENIVFTRHPLHRQRFKIHNLTDHHFLLVNIQNASDYILLFNKYNINI